METDGSRKITGSAQHRCLCACRDFKPCRVRRPREVEALHHVHLGGTCGCIHQLWDRLIYDRGHRERARLVSNPAPRRRRLFAGPCSCGRSRRRTRHRKCPHRYRLGRPKNPAGRTPEELGCRVSRQSRWGHWDSAARYTLRYSRAAGRGGRERRSRSPPVSFNSHRWKLSSAASCATCSFALPSGSASLHGASPTRYSRSYSRSPPSSWRASSIPLPTCTQFLWPC